VQDLAVVVLLMLIPLLAPGPDGASECAALGLAGAWAAIMVVAVAIVVVAVVGCSGWDCASVRLCACVLCRVCEVRVWLLG
jgi:hypothetical protein